MLRLGQAIFWTAIFGWFSHAECQTDDARGDDTASAPGEIAVAADHPETSQAMLQARETLARLRCSPPPPAEPGGTRFLTTEDRRGVLTGDFAADGSNYALVELPTDADQPFGVALLRWQQDQWNPCGLWKIEPVWRIQGWKETAEDHLPVTPATQPFWIERLAGDAAPWVVIAGDVWKYWQEHHVLRLDARQARLQWQVAAMSKPEFLPGGWLQLSCNSGHRSIWVESNFLRWRDGKLIKRASWHDETPYNDPEHPFVSTITYDERGRRQHEYVIRPAATENVRQDGFSIQRDGQRFCRVNFVWRDPIGQEQGKWSVEAAESAYLFEKLTGLSRRLFDKVDTAGEQSTPRLETVAGSRVRGRSEAVKLLTIPMPWRH